MGNRLHLGGECGQPGSREEVRLRREEIHHGAIDGRIERELGTVTRRWRLDFVKNAPKWGNDDDYVDDIMVRCLREVSRHAKEIKCPSGNNWPLLPENVSGNIHYSSVVGALPNGRRLGDALYDGGISPGPGLDRKGPTAVLKSLRQVRPCHRWKGHSLLNQRLSPTQLSGEKGYQLWKAYMMTWADLGLRSRAVQHGG